MPANIDQPRTRRRRPSPIVRILACAALLGGAACQTDRLPLAPTTAPAAPHVSADGHERVVYRSLSLAGSGGYSEDATVTEGALKTPKTGDPAAPSYGSTDSYTIPNASSALIKQVVANHFKDADDNDVSVLTISSHGGTDKLKTGSAEITGRELKEMTGAIKGTKIVIISACHSESLIDGADELGDDKTVVLVSAAKDQTSLTIEPMFREPLRSHAVFLGWAVAGLSDDGAGNARADSDKDGKVTVEELFNYAAPKTKASAAAKGETQDPKNSFSKPGGDALKKTPILQYNPGSLSTNPDTRDDTGRKVRQCGTSTRCDLGPRTSSSLTVYVQALFGLRSIEPTKSVNASVFVPPFTVGTPDPVSVTATKIDLSQSAQVELRVTDMIGTTVACDPVLVTVSRATGAPSPMTLTGLPQVESRISVSNGTPGLTTLRVEVNGRSWQLAGMQDGETRELDVASAMVPGERNTIVLTPLGRPGASAVVLIHD
jgi:hypothetical protein